jgi:D,D-heptose 1,7-bisphosphate phosphatase
VRQAVIVAGGTGSRLRSEGINTPKLLLTIGEKRVIDYLILELEREAFTDVLFILGDGNSEVIESLDRLNTRIRIKFTIEEHRKGTFGALEQSQSMLVDKFVVIFGDLLLINANVGGILNHFINSNFDIAVFCKNTDHPQDSDLIALDEEFTVNEISRYPHVPEWATSSIALAGVFYFSKKVIVENSGKDIKDISKDLLPSIMDQRPIRGYFHQGIVRDLGTVQRLRHARTLESSGHYSLSDSPMLLLDRDGVLNIDKGYVVSIENVTLTEFARPLIDLIRKRNWRYGIVTNQPAIARGMISESKAFQLTQKIHDLAAGDSLDFQDIFLCPHHPDSGFAEEVAHLKIKCFCRKPSPGLLLASLDQLKMRATSTLMIGDNISDVQAARAIGAEALHIHNSAKDKDCTSKSNFKCASPSQVIAAVDSWGTHDRF